MSRSILIWSFIVCVLLVCTSTSWADVPPPPVNQTIGKPDIAFSGLTEADCRVCHGSGVPDRHHNLYGDPIPADSLVPYPDSDGDGSPDTTYVCLNCHATGGTGGFVIERDCLICHTGGSPHHGTALALSGDCVACHGSIVDNASDGHYIPTYATSLVTPDRTDCSGCHSSGTDTGSGYTVLGNQDLHHGTGLSTCSNCHDFALSTAEQTRVCENCHGPDSLHNIQADSPNLNNVGTVVVGGEDAGYGHVGRDVSKTDSDCWGCHGFGGADLADISGPVAPTIYDARPAAMKTGTNTLVTLTGSALTNTVDDKLYESDAVLTAVDGSSATLKPGVIYEGLLKVTIPGDTEPGNYKLQAVKTDDEGGPVSSNPITIQVIPEVSITNVTNSDGIVTITGSGFAGYAEGSGTAVTGSIATGARNRTITTVEAKIVSWSDTVIKADFGANPLSVTVNSVFGSDTYPD